MLVMLAHVVLHINLLLRCVSRPRRLQIAHKPSSSHGSRQMMTSAHTTCMCIVTGPLSQVSSVVDLQLAEQHITI